METSKKRNRWILALVIILVILFIYRLTLVPDREEEISEQIEDIEWEKVDKIVISANQELNIIRQEGSYQLLTRDSIQHVPDAQIRSLFEAINSLQHKEQEVSQADWKELESNTSFILLKVYENTEQVLDLYLSSSQNNAYYRYTDSRNIYETDQLGEKQLSWLDSLTSNN